MKTKYFSYATWAISVIGLMASCKSPEPEIVESNYEYAIDKKKVEVDTPDPFHFDDAPYVYMAKEDQVANFSILKKTSGDMSVGDPKTVDLKVQLTRALSEDVTLTLDVDTKKTEELLTANPMYKELTKDALTFPQEIKIPAGEKSAKVSITLEEKDLDRYEIETTYALVLDFSSTSKALRFAKGFNLIEVKATASVALPQGNNVTAADNLPDGVTKYPSSDITPKSDYQSGRLWVMFDGRTHYRSNNWWVQSGSSTTLELKLASRTKVKAIVVWGNPYHGEGNKSLKGVTVHATNNGGASYVTQGSILMDKPANPVYIVFNEAIEVDAILLSDFVSRVDYADIVEIEVYTE